MTDLECYINARGFITFLQAECGLVPGDLIFLAGDLRDSTPRITAAVATAIKDSGCTFEYLGLIPTPALAYFAGRHGKAGIMVTGSHIPADRNGIKFYKQDGEILKADEQAIKTAVAQVRKDMYESAGASSAFTPDGSLKVTLELGSPNPQAAADYLDRYTKVFPADIFSGKKVVVYQHSAVGRDMMVQAFQALGADVVAEGRSDVFIPIDTENVTPKDQAYFKELAAKYPDCFAIVSTDGDSDRPFVIDESGIFNRGDVLGAVVARQLGADFCAFTASTSDAVDTVLTGSGVEFTRTRIGSPYVIAAMQEAFARGKQKVVGWEVNGGFLLGCDIQLFNGTLTALPTRDALLPILCALAQAAQSNQKVSDIFGELPKRFTQAGLLDNFPSETSKRLIQQFSQDTPENRQQLSSVFNSGNGFGSITAIDATDGVRMIFDNGDIAHIRPSGNAPQLRIYSVANSQERADDIVARGVSEPDGLLRNLANL
jgi:phosphomannomutase